MVYASLCTLRTMAGAILGYGVVSKMTSIRAIFYVAEQHKPRGMAQGSQNTGSRFFISAAAKYRESQDPYSHSAPNPGSNWPAPAHLSIAALPLLCRDGNSGNGSFARTRNFSLALYKILLKDRSWSCASKTGQLVTDCHHQISQRGLLIQMRMPSLSSAFSYRAISWTTALWKEAITCSAYIEWQLWVIVVKWFFILEAAKCPVWRIVAVPDQMNSGCWLIQ